jgi:hypothetical protein
MFGKVKKAVSASIALLQIVKQADQILIALIDPLRPPPNRL